MSNNGNTHDPIRLLGGVPILGVPKWECPVCGDQPPPAPNNPTVPRAYAIQADGFVTLHCMRCKVRQERESIPQLRRLGPADSPPEVS